MERGFLPKSAIEQRIQTKEDFKYIFGVEGSLPLTEGGYYLPEDSYITWSYIRSILNGDKKLLKVSQLKTMTTPPKFDGVRLSQMWAELKDHPEVAPYFPPCLGRTPTKEYFFAVPPTSV